MSAHIEYALISKVIETHDFSTLEKQQITSDFFLTPEMRAIYELLRLTYHSPETAGLVPSYEMVRQYFPAFNMVYAPDEVPILCQALRRTKLQVDLLQLAQLLQFGAEKDPMETLAKLKSATQTLASMEQVGNDLSMADAYSILMQRYQQVSLTKGMLGIPFPWDVLNEETQGMQNGQYIVFYARPKNMKTWVALYCAVHAYLKSRRRVLYYTREMPTLQIAMRVAAAMCGVNYKAFINGQLDPNILQYVQWVLQSLMNDEVSAGKHGHQPCFIITADRSPTGGGVTWLQSKIKEVKPDIVFVDGVYLMKDDRSGSRQTDWKNILHISQDIRQTALQENIPIVAITQANKKSDQMRGDAFEDMAYTDAFNQDADAVFKFKHIMKRDEATGMKKSEIFMFAPGLREGILDGIVINGVPATDFSFVRAIQPDEEVEEDYNADKKKAAAAAAPKPNGAAFRSNPANYYQTDPSIKVMK